MAAAAEAFRLGVNYWPAQTAMQWLARCDPGVVRADFARVAAAGMDTVRIFLRWEDVQPTSTTIDRAALAHVVDAQALLADAVAAALCGHPAVWSWDLGNESSNCTIPPDAVTADRWLERISTVLRERDPKVLVTTGTHLEDLEDDRMIGPAEAARWCDYVCMHGYPAYADWSAGATDEDFVPFLAELTGWLAGDVPVLFAELGQSTPPPGAAPSTLQADEHAAGRYVAATVDALRACGSLGALVWCYSDDDARLHDSPPLDLAAHERSFGLWRADGTPKPAVAALSARRGITCLPTSTTRPWLDITLEELVADRRGQLRRLYQRYRASPPS